MSVSLDKVEQKAPELVSLVKKAGVILEKHSLQSHVAKVALILDHSGSMSRRYAEGEVQDLAERALALGCNFDDDGDIDIFLFDDHADHVGSLTIDNYKGGIDRLRQGRRMGTTDYAAAIHEVLAFYELAQSKRGGIFGGGANALKSVGKLPVKDPVYAIFVTDGEPNDKKAAEEAMRAAAAFPVFWQFVGLGTSFAFLEKLDTMPGRVVDNAGFFSAQSHHDLSDDEFLGKLLQEYPSWIPQARTLKLIV